MLALNMLWLGACSSCGEDVITTNPKPILKDMAPDMDPIVDEGPGLPEAATITLSESVVSIEIGKERALTLDVLDEEGLSMDPLPLVMWSSTDAGVARAVFFPEERRVVVESVSVGVATLTAQTRNGVRATIEVEILARAPVRIDITPAMAELVQRDTAQFTAKVFAAEEFELLDRDVSWESADNQIATVNAAGLVTGQTPGTTEITATLEGLSATVSVTVIGRQPDRVQILTAPLTMLVNDIDTIEAVVRDDRGGVLDDLAISWSIDAPELADVDAITGEVTAKQAGMATITATHEMLSATLAITISDRPITNIDVIPDMTTLLLGEQVQMNATAFADDGSVHPDQRVTWSLQPAMSTSISITPDGLVSALTTGTTSVAATSVGASNITSAPSFITVIAAVDTIVITPMALSLIEGESSMVTAKTFDQNNNELFRQVTWQSNDPFVAAIDPNGRVVAIAPGTTQLTAEVENVSQSITIDVLPIPVERVEVTPTVVTLLPGDTAQLTAQLFDISDSPLTGRTVDWQSSASTVASVDAMTGLVTGLITGRATITATVEGKSATAEVVVPTLFKDVLAGGSHSCVMTTDDNYHCFGRNQFNVLGLTGNMDRLTPEITNIPMEGFAQISSLTLHQCAITPQQKLFCWGANFAGQLGLGSSTGTSSSPSPIEPTMDFLEVSSGGAHTCALEAITQTAYCWGSNDYGQLGLGTFDQETSPEPVPGGLLFETLSTGGSHTCGIEAVTQKLYCWGRNDAGQLGIDNMSSNVSTPTEVDNMRTYVSVYSGPEHTCAITTIGDTYCWGGNSDGQLGSDTGGVDSVTHLLVPGNLNFVALDAASLHTCALTATGQMYCWGANNNGQLGDGTTTSSAAPMAVSGGITFTKMDLGGIHTCALSDAQIAYCWGSGSNGRIGNGSLAGSNVPFPLTLAP